MEDSIPNKINILDLLEENNHLLSVTGSPRSRKGTNIMEASSMLLEREEIEDVMMLHRTKKSLQSNIETHEEHINYDHQLIAYISNTICPNFPKDDRPYWLRALEHDVQCNNKAEIPDSFFKARKDRNFDIPTLKELASKGWEPSAVMKGAIDWADENNRNYLLMSTYAKAKYKTEDLALPTEDTLMIFDEGRHSRSLEERFTWKQESYEIASPKLLVENLGHELKKIRPVTVKPIDAWSPDDVDLIEEFLNKIGNLLINSAKRFATAYKFNAFEENLKSNNYQPLFEPLDAEEYRQYCLGMAEESDGIPMFPDDKNAVELALMKSRVNKSEEYDEVLNIWDFVKKKLTVLDFSEAQRLKNKLRNEIKANIDTDKALTEELVDIYGALQLAEELEKNETEIEIRFTEAGSGKVSAKIVVQTKDNQIREEWKDDSAGLVYIDATPPPKTDLADYMELEYGFPYEDFYHMEIDDNEEARKLMMIFENRRRNILPVYNEDAGHFKHLGEIVDEAKMTGEGVTLFTRSKMEQEKILKDTQVELPKKNIEYFRGDEAEGRNIDTRTITSTGIPFQNIYASKNMRNKLAKVSNRNIVDVEKEYATYKACQELLQGGLRHLNKDGISYLVLFGTKKERLNDFEKFFPHMGKLIDTEFQVRKLREDNPNNNVTAGEKAGRLRLILNQENYKEDFFDPDSIWSDRLYSYGLSQLQYNLLDSIAKSEPINKGKLLKLVSKGNMEDRMDALEELEEYGMVKVREGENGGMKYSINWRGPEMLRELETKQ